MARRDDLSTPRGSPGAPSYDPDAFARFAERAARFLGTGRYLAAQTILVFFWILLNAAAASLRWDPYPFILLNLAFSTQAAYAAPLILLAQNRQADRDDVIDTMTRLTETLERLHGHELEPPAREPVGGELDRPSGD